MQQGDEHDDDGKVPTGNPQDSASPLSAATAAAPGNAATTSNSNNNSSTDSSAEPSMLLFRKKSQTGDHERSHSATSDNLTGALNTSGKKRRRKRRSLPMYHHSASNTSSRSGGSATGSAGATPHSCWCLPRGCWCRNTSRHHQHYVRGAAHCMNLLARLVVWGTVVALGVATIWYSVELYKYGKDPHLIAWFSAGAFVLLGFPISMGGIVGHLANYNQPHVQVYVVRILWMVPIYSVESWLAMRYYKQAIYIETLRDLYESYVLYSFLQFLIQVLGGEEALVLMLKDKSPTRGVHMWGLQWCGTKPWLMGQPVRRSIIPVHHRNHDSTLPVTASASSVVTTPMARRQRRSNRVHWTSPFFVKCKFGVLQYVLLKFVLSIAVMILERHGLYKEGNFTYKGGYLYICILTNVSQCWALYCLIFFYYATKNELAAIRPVGKFLSVKALVFFTWWQSVFISILYKMNMIPHYTVGNSIDGAEPDWTPEDVAKAIQDYLICMEMFVAAVIHTFVFPHSEYSPQAVQARNRALQHIGFNRAKRLGRRQHHLGFDDAASKTSMDHLQYNMEMVTLDSQSDTAEHWDDLYATPPHPYSKAMTTPASTSPPDTKPFPTPIATPGNVENTGVSLLRVPSWEENLGGSPLDKVDDTSEADGAMTTSEDEDGAYDDTSAYDDDKDDEYDEEEQEHATLLSQDLPQRTGFVRALLDSAIPRDLHHNTVGIVKGDYNIERKTLLQHATTSDQYDLFAAHRQRQHHHLDDDDHESANQAPGDDSGDHEMNALLR